jgi:hypothetical protein
MLIPKLCLVLIFFAFLSSCPFDDNRKIEKIMAESEIKFQDLFNQERFQEIYVESDNELKTKFTEQQFVSYLKFAKNDFGEIKETPHVWINDELKDGAKKILFNRTKFSDVEMVGTEKAIFREKFEWNLRDNEARLASYEIEKLCDKPCRLVIKAK